MVSSKDGGKLKESPDLDSKSIATVPYDTEVYLKSNSTESTSDSVIDKKEQTSQLEKWVFVITEFYLNPGDYGYSEDLIEPTQIEDIYKAIPFLSNWIPPRNRVFGGVFINLGD